MTAIRRDGLCRHNPGTGDYNSDLATGNIW